MFSERDLIFSAPEHSILQHATGGFARRVCILLPAGPEHHERLGFLTKILAAVRLDLDKDTLLIEIPVPQPATILPVLKEKQAEVVLVFGLSPAQIGLRTEIPLYLPQPFYGATFLFAEALAVLEPDTARKARLWQAIQHLFP